MTERDRDFRDRWQSGPTGPAPTTESVGDPEEDNPQSAAEEGAAAGGALGAAVAGPFGLAAGAIAGAAVGTAGEVADGPQDAGFERRDQGTGPVDPIVEAPQGAWPARPSDRVADASEEGATR